MTRHSKEHIYWTMTKLAEFIQDGGGSFRKLIYDYFELEPEDYADAFNAGGLLISNTIFDALHCEIDEVRLAIDKACNLYPHLRDDVFGMFHDLEEE